MYQIRSFFINSVQRSQSVTYEIVQQVLGELQKRMSVGASFINNSVDIDTTNSNVSRDQLLLQFPVVKSEEDMVCVLRESLRSNSKPFDVIITPFGCDSKSLPESVRKLLPQDEVTRFVCLAPSVWNILVDVPSATPCLPNPSACRMLTHHRAHPHPHPLQHQRLGLR
jgi:hypothetical protein